MLQLENTTPFAAGIHLFANAQGIDTLYIGLKATFRLGTGELVLADDQLPLQLGDEYWGDPAESSVKYANEAHLAKVGTDVILGGCAQLPGSSPCEELVARVSVGPLVKSVRVFGDREWTGSTFGRRVSPVARFEKMPLIWERAFGGFHVQDAEKGKIHIEERNPIGRGFRGKRKVSEFVGTLLPNLEDPSAPLNKPGDRQTPSCFSFVAPGWQPRKAFVGTYDEPWQKSRAPYLPTDFDPRFLSTAPEGLASMRYLTGGEPVELVNVSAAGLLRFRLPFCETSLSIRVAGRDASPPFLLETVFFEPEEDRCSMTWRAEFTCDKQALAIETIKIESKALEISGAVRS